MSSKAQRHKPYDNLQILSIPTFKWKDLNIDFTTRLPKSKVRQRIKYDWVFEIDDRLTQIVYNKPILTTIKVD